MTNKTELERLVAVETKIDMLLESNRELISAFKNMQAEQSTYIQRAQHEADILALENKIEQSKRRSAMQTWLTGTLAALFGVIMTILIQAYFE